MTLMKIQTIRQPTEFDFEIIKNTSPSYINPEFIVYITISDYCAQDEDMTKWYYIHLKDTLSFVVLEDEYIRILKILKEQVI